VSEASVRVEESEGERSTPEQQQQVAPLDSAPSSFSSFFGRESNQSRDSNRTVPSIVSPNHAMRSMIVRPPHHVGSSGEKRLTTMG
jgi:hypothetical protein